jgi:uncharacterized protein YgbK (DUF1537 family)
MKAFLGVIADDFTGATDIASMLRRSGLPVSLRLGVPDMDAQAESVFEVIALKIRTEPVESAVSAAESACDWLTRNGARQIYWKYCSTFDSTPQGNIGPVAEALMRRLSVRQTVYSPAFPENGRRVFLGHLFVDQALLSDSSMKDHPLTPMNDPNLLRILTPQVSQHVGLIEYQIISDDWLAIRHKLEALRKRGVAHVVMDAFEDAHLQAQARAVADYPLITGGSAMAQHLPEAYESSGMQLDRVRDVDTPVPTGGIITLSGSGSQATQAQVEAFLGSASFFRLDPLLLATSGDHMKTALEWLARQQPDAPKLVFATTNPDDVRRVQAELGRKRAGQIVEQALAQIAVAAADAGYQRFVIAGGETSGAVVGALGVSSLRIGPEISPGVPWTFAERDGNPLAIALKSGNFGDVTFFSDAPRSLQA